MLNAILIARNSKLPQLPFIATVVVVISVSSSTLGHAQAVLYDNTDHLWEFPHGVTPKNVTWIGPVGNDKFFAAQGFYMGNHDTIASVNLPMGKETNSTATGSFRVAIWDQNDAGFPNEEIAELGVVDVSDLAVTADFNIPPSDVEGALYLPEYRFDGPIGDLIPGEKYFVVFDFDHLTPGDPFGLMLQGISNSPIGTNGAGKLLDTGDIHAAPPIANDAWQLTSRIFSPHAYLQMSVIAEGNPYEPFPCAVGEVYHQTFDDLGVDGSANSPLPSGWSFFDETTGSGPIYSTIVVEDFPVDRRLDTRTTLFNVGVPGDVDRALAIGTPRQAGASTLQFVTDVVGGEAKSVQLSFDIEAWDAASSRDNPGEAAFNVVMDLDTGEGFQQIMDLGNFSTRETLEPPREDFVNGNDDAYRASFDTGAINLQLPEGSQLRVRWQADLESETRGWVYGLDNVSLGMFSEARSILGDFDDDGLLSPQDIDLLSNQFGVTPIDAVFDVNSDGVVDLADHRHWVESEDYANTFIGDTNLDGTVNFPDFLALSGGFGQSGGWAEGDMDGNGQVEFPDFLELSANFGKASVAVSSVPEPSSLYLLSLGLMALVSVRRFEIA